MLRPRDPRVPAAAHSGRHASVKEWVDKNASLLELEAFPVGRCLVDHLGRRITGLVRDNGILPV
jgi:hypothetical protein